MVKVLGDVPPARVYFFKLLSLAKGILLPILVHLVWARVCFLAILVDFSLGKGMLFGNFLSKKCQTSANFFQILVQRMQKFGKFCLENANSWHF